MSTKRGVFKLNWNEFAGKLPFLTDLGEGSSVVSGGPGRYAVWSPMSAVGGAMQEAYEQLERRSLENCLAGCFDLRNDSGEGVYVPRTITVSYPGPNGEELIRSPLAVLMGHGVMNMEYVKVTLPLPENEAGGGEMELHFRLRESPEGVARIETELNRRSKL